MPVEANQLANLLLALVLGGLIGWERELYDKTGGVQDKYTDLCYIKAFHHLLVVGTISETDSSRIAAQIVSGIGFLGAGVIIRGKAGAGTDDRCHNLVHRFDT
jgi:putative Mg2+ transporter-C (MgtC) family protein